VLTERERQVLRLVAEGRATKQIARALSITERTVKFHLASAAHKLGAQTRAQAAALATRRGLL
jgi:DNA-binding CsgD family transcriptional regulator